MDPDVNFKEDFPLLDKILHVLAPVVVAGVVFIVVYWLQLIIWMIFIPLPFVGFAPTAVESFPLLAYFNPMWIPAGVVTLIVMVAMRRKNSIQRSRFRNHNVPTMFYEEPTVIPTQPTATQSGTDLSSLPDQTDRPDEPTH